MTRFATLLLLLALGITPLATADYFPGARTLLDAHNCYPYFNLWSNRIERALACPLPISIEMDQVWDNGDGKHAPRAVLAHSGPFSGKEPTLDTYFFEKVRPIVEAALQDGNTATWPLIVLNVNDARGNDTAIYKQLRQTLERYQPWLCSAPRGNGNNPPPLPLDLRPILILTGGGARGECFDNIPPEDRIYVFGSGNPDRPATNFNRWVNYSWSAVEPEGQSNTGEWTQQDRQRLETLVNNAHENGYWIRFYSLDGFTPLMTAIQGWSPEYNFGSKEQAAIRWRAAKEAGVDFIASDQYEEAAAVIQETAK